MITRPRPTRLRATYPQTASLLRKAGIDRAVGWTVLSKGWFALSGFVTLFLITHTLTRVQQGFYYTFGSVLGLAVLFELGLSMVLMQFASHERARLEWTADGLLGGDSEAKVRLSSMLRLSLIWYGTAAALLVVTVLPGGIIFFGRYAPAGAAVTWQWPWAWIVLVTAATIALTPVLAVLEGCGLIAEIASIQFTQNVLGSTLLWLALSGHWRLFAAPVTSTTGLVCLLIWLWRRKRPFLHDLLTASAGHCGFSWQREIWPVQWRMALSSVSGYLIFQVFTPMLFATHGAAAAGQMGLSMTIMGAIATISLGWMTAKSARFGTLIARREFQELDRLFFPCLWQSWGLVALGGLAFWLGVLGLHHQHNPLSHRLLAPLPLGLMICTTVINHAVSAEGIYLRAHRREPFLGLALTIAGLVSLSSLLFSGPYGATGMMAGYFAVNLTIGGAGGTWVFLDKRRKWHTSAAGGDQALMGSPQT